MAKQITDARQAPFVWFDVKLDDAGLSAFAFRLYCHLARRTNGGKSYFFETLSHAAQVCQMSLSTTQRAMRQLEERCFVKLIADPLGYPRTYAITDKAEWDQPPVSQTEGGSVRQTGEVGQTDRGGRSDRPEGVGHTDRQKKTHGRKGEKKTPKEIAVPAEAAAAATRTRAPREKPAAAAASKKALSIYDRDQIKEFVIATKSHSTNPGGLARTLHENGEEDDEITAWIRAQMERAQAELRQQQPVSPAALDALRSEANALGLHIPGLN